MDSTESHQGSLIAWMEAAQEAAYRTARSRLGLTTTPILVMPSTPSTTPYFRPVWEPAKAPLFTSQTSPASSAPTSSNTQRLDGSLYYLQYKTHDGWARTPDIGDVVQAELMYETFAGVYHFVTLIKVTTTTIEETVRDSSIA